MINAATANEIIMKMTMKTASIQFPKMQLINSFSMKELFNQLGVYTIFDRSASDLQRVLANYTGGRFDDDIFDQLEDTKENAINELQEAFPGCVLSFKDVERKDQCTKSTNCRYGAKTCYCCSKLGYRKKRSAVTPVYVNEVIHKVNVVINEKGTEGGAVTATLLDRNAPEVNFRTNGPFLILIRDETTKLPLFYGNVYEPTV